MPKYTNQTIKRHLNIQNCSPCSDMNGFERPRYFPGQLLTNHDLEAAQQYVIEKNRLHNRYLVGTGVVCGLAVRCHPTCNGVVVVEPGYAIDGCGNDVVVGASVEFDVLQYLKACEQEAEPDCYGKIPATPSRCDAEAPKEYCLMLHYAEEPIKPVTALIRDNSCSTNRCEPSRIRETFRLALAEKSKKELCVRFKLKDKQPNPKSLGDTLKWLLQSILELTPSDSFLCQVSNCFSELEINDIDFRDQDKLFSQLRNKTLERFKREPKIRCDFIETISEIDNQYQLASEDKKRDLLNKMLELWLEGIIDCLCDSLLVPCPQVDSDQGVLLACFTVRNDKIEKICNLPRTQLVTNTSLHYWMEPLFASLKKLTEQGCCDPFSNQKEKQDFGNLMPGLIAMTVGQSTGTRQIYDSSYREQAVRVNNAVFSRGNTAIKMVQNFSGNIFRNLQSVFTNSQANDPERLTVLDVYDRPVEEVQTVLQSKNISFADQPRVASVEEIDNLQSILDMAWIIPSGSQVELVVNPETNRVAKIRMVQGERNDS
jgi:hypothetical protein